MEIEVMKEMTKAMQSRAKQPTIAVSSKEENLDGLFGKMIASELKQFPESIKFHVKHELNNVIYKSRTPAQQSVIRPASATPLNSPQTSTASGEGWYSSPYSYTNMQ